MLLCGGCLSTPWLIQAYRHGIFPWPIPDAFGRTHLAWFSPDPRAIIDLNEFHAPARLLRRVRGGEFTFTVDEAFSTVVALCAERPRSAGTWITSEMRQAYQRLHENQIAHSVEVWRSGQLVGGLYGVSVGGYFSAESMFHRRRDASKAALYHLVQQLRGGGFSLLDVQLWSQHLAQFGAKEIARSEFLRRLEAALQVHATFGPQ